MSVGHRTNMNSWLFGNDNNKPVYSARDHMTKERRNLLNLHLDGDITTEELQQKLKELRGDG